MEGELEILDSLRALQYDGKCSNDADLAIALKGGIRNEDFRGLVVWLTEELHMLRKTDEKLSIEVDDPSEFAMELSALLKELGCPYNEFVMGSLSERYETMESRLQLLDYLITEIMASKMCWKLHPVDNSYVISKSTTNTAKALEQISRDLQVGKPPESITPKALFDKLNFKVEETVRERKPGILSEPLFNTKKSLTENQWKMLERIHNDLDTEYNLRRQVLLTRLEVTIQSFQWSDKMKSREQEIIERYESKRNELESLKLGGIDTNIVALLAAREDLAIIEKTSSANVRKNTASKIQKHVIGSVPDRGGRANEHAPPPPEMPSWQQQRATGPGGRGGNFRSGGGNNRGAGNNRGGGGHWQQFSAPPQQQRFVQQPQFEQDRDQTLVSGSGRVQGSGWTQKGYDFNDGSERRDATGYYNNSYQGGPRGRGNSNYRGRSNYNRGGQRH